MQMYCYKVCFFMNNLSSCLVHNKTSLESIVCIVFIYFEGLWANGTSQMTEAYQRLIHRSPKRNIRVCMENCG